MYFCLIKGELMARFIFYYWLGVNFWTFCVFGFDKYCARSGRRRVPESRLWCLVWLGGSLGAWVAMWVFRHKTLHKKFIYGVPSVWVFQLLIVGIIWYVSVVNTL